MERKTFIAIWGSMADLARAIGEGETTVRNWFARGSIPARYDARLIEASREAGHPITPADLFELRLSMMRSEGADHAVAPGRRP